MSLAASLSPESSDFPAVSRVWARVYRIDAVLLMLARSQRQWHDMMTHWSTVWPPSTAFDVLDDLMSFYLLFLLGTLRARLSRPAVAFFAL